MNQMMMWLRRAIASKRSIDDEVRYFDGVDVGVVVVVVGNRKGNINKIKSLLVGGDVGEEVC